MICPFRKQTETVDGTTSEYFMECYESECPYYRTEQHFDDFSTEAYCEKTIAKK